MIEAPWLANGGHGASVRHHDDLCATVPAMPPATVCQRTPTAPGSPAKVLIDVLIRKVFGCCSESTLGMFVQIL
jgi:hypothetical protein